MATAVASVEPAFIPGLLTEESPNVPACIPQPQSRWDSSAAVAVPVEESDPEGEEPAKKETMGRSGNSLAAAILWLAVEDFRFGNRETHETARKFLYPEIPAAKEHLAAVCGMMNDLSFRALREALDRMRPQWDGERQPRKGDSNAANCHSRRAHS